MLQKKSIIKQKNTKLILGGNAKMEKSNITILIDMDDTIYEAMRDAEKLIQIHRK